MFRLVLNNARAAMPRRSFARMYSARASSFTTSNRLYWGVGLSLVPAYIAFTQLEAVKNDAEVAASDSVKLALAEVETKDAAPETTSSEGDHSDDHSGDHSGAAYNPETGEINWDCPCLGGMAHGPCGEEFKEAFACFVYSESEPKGIDCITKFEVMRNCFREHPEHYKEELYDDEAALKAENEVGAEESTQTATEKVAEKVSEKVTEAESAIASSVSAPATNEKPTKASKKTKSTEASSASV